jgi:hypothetical protein
MLKERSKPREMAAGVVGAVSPYADQLAHDPMLRRRLAKTIVAAAAAQAQVRRRNGFGGLALRLASDAMLRRQIVEAVAQLQQAKERIDHRRRLRSRVVVLSLAGAGLAVLAVPVVRGKLHGASTEPTAPAESPLSE